MGSVFKSLFGGQPEQKEVPPPVEPSESAVKSRKKAQISGGRTQTILTSGTGLSDANKGKTLLGE